MRSYDCRVSTSVNDPADPASLETSTFPLVRRGFEPAAVRARFKAAATAIRELQVERDRLAAAAAEYDSVSVGQLEAHRIAEALGAEATKVLEAAHLAAVERSERAEREALAVREEAISAADATRESSRAESDEMLETARRTADALIEDGRAHGQHMVAEAQTVRERMLNDLSRKRQAGRAQVEQLRAARDRLLESLAVVQQSLDTAMADLVESVPEARAAADRAGLRIEEETAPTAEHLEAEIEAARMVGHPLVADIIDPGEEPTFEADKIDLIAELEGFEPSVGERPELFDVEAESDAPEPELEEEAEEEPEAEEEVQAEDSGDGVDDLFAKLRTPEPEPEDDSKPEPQPEAEPVAELEVEPEPETESEPESEPWAGGEDREKAHALAIRALKKVVVDEQGVLLDGVRRNGVETLRELVDDPGGQTDAYNEVAIPAIEDYVAGLTDGGTIDLADALSHLHSIAIEPMRHRLSEFVRRSDDGDDPDETEMTDAVRAMYRESRSRRIPEAVSAALVAVDALVALASGPPAVRWVVEPGGPCGPDCADNALAGAVVPGETFPTGEAHPPLHVACTCRLVPVTT